MQTNAILLYYNALTFVFYIPLLVALIVFYRFTGLSFVDIDNLREEHIQRSFDGNIWIKTKRQKTLVNSNVPLLDVPKAILEKYKNRQPNGKLLPVISNQKMNEYLDEIATLCNFSLLSSYFRNNNNFVSRSTY